MSNCKNNQCNSQVSSRGYCRKHYVRMMRHGELEVIYPKNQYENCSVAGCENKHSCKSYCNKHYIQFRKYGRVQTREDMMARWKSNRRGVHPNKGKKVKWAKSHIEAIKNANKHRRPWNKIGDGVTAKDKLERARFRKTMQKVIFERDDFTCQICDIRGGYLQVDHIKKWSDHPDLRFVESNCRTLCMACHYYVTFKRKIPEGIIWGHNFSRRVG